MYLDCVHAHRRAGQALFVWKKKSIRIAKETYAYGKRGLFMNEKRPVHEWQRRPCMCVAVPPRTLRGGSTHTAGSRTRIIARRHAGARALSTLPRRAVRVLVYRVWVLVRLFPLMLVSMQ